MKGPQRLYFNRTQNYVRGVSAASPLQFLVHASIVQVSILTAHAEYSVCLINIHLLEYFTHSERKDNSAKAIGDSYPYNCLLKVYVRKSQSSPGCVTAFDRAI